MWPLNIGDCLIEWLHGQVWLYYRIAADLEVKTDLTSYDIGQDFIKLYTDKTRYDYNLTIMESPKLATDNRFKK
jgi:hypothetical protein